MNNWLAALVKQLLSVISPKLKQALAEFVQKLEADAKATPNPWDDIFVGVRKFVLGL